MPEVSLPEHFEWVTEALSEKEICDLLAAMEQPLNLSIRFNPLKEDIIQFAAQLEKRYRWKLEPVPFCPTGFWIREGGEDASRTIEHRLGYFYIQEAASMLPPELLDLDGIDQPLILDMAASPGGKTTHLAAQTGDRGLIIANDASRSRIPALQIVLGNWGVVNQAITCLPGEIFGEIAPNTFDAVLLDAPCSMQGLRSAESHAARSITKKEIGQLANRQTRLLVSALRTVKPGGQVVYSTCTLTPQENERVLAKILDRFPDQVEIMDISDKLQVPAPGLSGIMGKEFHPSIRNALRIWPHLMGTAGFFSAKIVKTAPFSEISNSSKPIRGRKPQVRSLNSNEIINIIQAFQNQYGIDLNDLMDLYNLRLREVNGRTHLFPVHLGNDLSWLPWLSVGMPLGKALPDSWQPSHQFATRFASGFKKGVIQLDDQHLDTWLRGGDIRGFATTQAKTGSVVLVRDASGRNLGLGKLLASRLRNLLPTRLF